MTQPTIFALSSGSLPSGVAVIRISGPGCVLVSDQMLKRGVDVRSASLRNLYHPTTNVLLDQVLVIDFPMPNSFTGEHVVELHCHGGRASVASVLEALSCLPDYQVAEAGEFSRRAFENGKLDLTQLEGLSDIIAAQTEMQRRQALSQVGGVLRNLYDGWRQDLIRCRALIEAELDFADEDDVPGSVSDQVWTEVDSLKNRIVNHLDDQHSGEIIRDGFSIALMGKPNAGKSSLLNALAKRDIAIVTAQPGTTRDVLEANLDIDGHLVRVFDTAGIRKSDDIVENEGIKRAEDAGRSADLVLWLHAADDESEPKPFSNSVVVRSKADLGTSLPASKLLDISSQKDEGLTDLFSLLKGKLSDYKQQGEQPILSRQRHRNLLESVLVSLKQSLSPNEIEKRSEHLRIAGEHLGRITGRIDVEDLLDTIFSEFCVGK